MGGQEEGAWQDYTAETLHMLAHLDGGVIPPYLTTTQHTPPLHFTDGHLVLEVRDYRHMQMQHQGMKEPQVRHILLRPTQETVALDVRAVVQEAGLDDPHCCAMVEGEVLKHIRGRLALMPSPRVFQVLNLLTFNRTKGASVRPSREEMEDRALELWDAMGEAMLGLDAPQVEEEEEAREEVEGVKEEEKREGEDVGPITALLRRLPVLPRGVRERLQRLRGKEEERRGRDRRERERRIALKREEELEEEEVVDTSRSIKTAETATRLSNPSSSSHSSFPSPAMSPLSSSSSSTASSHLLPLLAYSSFTFHTSSARHNAASNLLLLDSEARDKTLSGPGRQVADAQRAYALALAEYKKEQAVLGVSSSSSPPVYKKPFTIASKFDTSPLTDAGARLRNPNEVGGEEWTTWSFSAPITHHGQRVSMLVELFVHAVPVVVKEKGATPGPTVWSGMYEVWVRWSTAGTGEGMGAPTCVEVGTQQEMRTFVKEFARCVVREGGRQLNKEAVVLDTPPIPTQQHDNILHHIEEQQRHAVEDTTKHQHRPSAPQGPPPLAPAPPVNGTRRHPAGKQPMQAGQPPSSLGLPAMYNAGAQPRREEGAQGGGRMPAGYSYPVGVGGMRPAGGEGGHPSPPHSSSPPPLSQGNVTPPMVFPPPAVPPPYHPHNSSHGPHQGGPSSRSVPGHGGYGGGGGGGGGPTTAPSGAPQPMPQLTAEQMRVREQQRVLQQQRFAHQQGLLMRQQGGYPPQSAPSTLAPPSGALSPRAAHGRTSTSPQPAMSGPAPVSPNQGYRGGVGGGGGQGGGQGGHPTMSAQQYAEYQQRKMQMQQQMQRERERGGGGGGGGMDPRADPRMQAQHAPQQQQQGQGQGQAQAQQQGGHGGGSYVGGGSQRYSQEQLQQMQRERQHQSQSQAQSQQYPPPPMAHSPNPSPLMHPQYAEQQRR